MSSLHLHLRLNREKQADVIKRLESEKNMTAFIVDCVRAQIFAEDFAKNIFRVVDEEGAEDGEEG